MEVVLDVHHAASSSALSVAPQSAVDRPTHQRRSPPLSPDAMALDRAEISTAARVMARAVMDKSPTLQLPPDQLRAMSTGHER